METRQERRAQERAAERAAKRSDAPPRPDAGQVVIRTVVVMAPDMVQEFYKLVSGNNPLAAQIARELQHVHRIPPGTPVQLAGIMVHVREELGEGAAPKEPSRIVLPGGPLPPPPTPRKKSH